MTKPMTALDHLSGGDDVLRDFGAQFGDDIWFQDSSAGAEPDAQAYVPESFSFTAVKHGEIVRDVAAAVFASHADQQSGAGHLSTQADAGPQSPAFEPAHLVYAPMGGSGSPDGASPSLASTVAFINGINANGTVAATSFWTWNDNTPATYAGDSNAHKWGAATADTPGGTIDYYFTPGSDWTTTEKSVFTACLTLWSDIANIHFALTTDAADAQLTFTRGAAGSGAYDESGWSGSGGAGTVGGTALWSMTGSEVSIDTTENGFGPITGSFSNFGGYVWMTILHELGHAIGLGHSGPYNDGSAGSTDPDSAQFSAYDTRLWSIMSYIMPSDTATYSSQYPVTGTNWGTSTTGGYIYQDVPTTPMPLDMLAAQELYGASTAAAYSGGQIFGFHSNITDVTKEFYNFSLNAKPVVTIWDSGTGNTLDLSGFSAAATIDLNPGTFSSCDGMVNNIAIAFNTRIDTADGGSGADTIIANADVDKLNGNGGNDTFDMGATFTATDQINGGAGSNTLVLDGNYATNLVFGSNTMQDIQEIMLTTGYSYDLTPADLNVASGATLTVDGHTLGATDKLTYNGVKETNGKLVLIGGADNDVLTGGSGNDQITGGLGADQLKGGPGSDTFIYASVAESTSGKHDTILDFDFSSDKIHLWFTPAGVLPAINSGALSTASFDADLHAALGSLTAYHAVLFTPNSGNLSGETFLVVDANGQAGYQSGKDLVIDLDHPANAASFGAGTFT